MLLFELLSGVKPFGGDTLWASMTAAYDALSQPMKEFLAGLRAVHDGGGFRTIASDAQKQDLRVHGAVDLAYELEGSDRFRINIFRQRGSLALILRVIPEEIPSFDKLLLPPQVKELAK